MQTNPASSYGRIPRLLSLDSGGQRGLSQLTILAELMRQLNHDVENDAKARPRDVFDMICGTGSGGFIAILLVVFGLDVETTKEEFIDLSAKIFDLDVEARDRTEALRTHVNNLISKYGLEQKRPLLDPNIGSRDCKLVVPVSYKISVTSKCILRNFKVREERPYDVTVAEALMATLANPPFFTPISISQDATTFEHIGGNLAFSNPAPEVLAEARNAYHSGKENVWLLSIGCGHPDVVAIPTISNALGWHSLLETLAKNAEGRAQQIEAEMGDQDRYHRFSVLRGLGDHTQAITLKRGDIITHTTVYLGDTRVSREISRCVDYLKPPGLVVSNPSRTRTYHARLVILLPLCILLWSLIFAYQGVCGKLLGIEHQLCRSGSLGSKTLENPANKPVDHTVGYLDGVSPNLDLAVGLFQPYNDTPILERLDSDDESIFPPGFLTKPFIMRKEPWEYITHVMLGNADSEKRGGRMLVVTGMAGCGKTQIVLKFMRDYEAQFAGILLIDGSSEPRIREDIIRYVRQRENFHLSFKDCLLFLSRAFVNGPLLIVYDNVDDPNINLIPLLPHGSNCAIIITSRNRSIGALSPNAHLELDKMTIAEAVELLLYPQTRSNTNIDQVRDDARAAVEALGCLPIALQQARRYMFETQMPARMYLKRLSESRDDILAHTVEYQPDMRYLSTYAAFTASITILPDRARQFLQLLSFFHWSKFPLELVLLIGKYNFSEDKTQYIIEHGDEYQTGKAALEEIFLFETQWNPTNLDKLIVSLHKHSLITIVAGIDTSLIEMNPLLHGWLQSSLPEEYRLKYQSAAVVLLTFGTRFHHTPSAQYLESHISHLSHLWGGLHINNAAAFGEILSNAGAFVSAVLLQEKVVAALRGPTGARKVTLANSLSALGITYRAAGRLRAAELAQVEVLQLRKEILGERHPDTITAFSNLAATYSKQGRLKETESLRVEVLKLRKEILGEHHPDTITASSNLAVTYVKQGRMKEAELLDVEVLRLRKEILGEHHPKTISASSNLAVTYNEQGRVKDAESLQLEVLRLRKEILGERHPNTIDAYSNLAVTYSKQGRIEEAELLKVEVIRLRKEILGECHPDTIDAYNNLAVTYSKQGRMEETELLRVEVLKLRKEILGEHHPDTINAYSNLAVTYNKQGRMKEAELLDVEVLRLGKEILGEPNSDTISASSNLAVTYNEQGRVKDAELLQVEVLRLRKEILGEHHPDTIDAYSNLAVTYSKQGRMKETGLLLVEVLRLRKEILGERHPDTISAYSFLAFAYHMQGRNKETELLLLEALRLWKETLGERHPNTILASSNLAIAYSSQGRMEEAELLQVEVLRLRQEILGRYHPETVWAMLNLAGTYGAQVNKVSALNLLEEADSIISEAMGRSHPLYEECKRLKSRIRNTN